MARWNRPCAVPWLVILDAAEATARSPLIRIAKSSLRGAQSVPKRSMRREIEPVWLEPEHDWEPGSPRGLSRPSKPTTSAPHSSALLPRGTPGSRPRNGTSARARRINPTAAIGSTPKPGFRTDGIASTGLWSLAFPLSVPKMRSEGNWGGGASAAYGCACAASSSGAANERHRDGTTEIARCENSRARRAARRWDWRVGRPRDSGHAVCGRAANYCPGISWRRLLAREFRQGLSP
jgi:hypothetical protein